MYIGRAHDGAPAAGAFVRLTDPQVVDVMASQGLDYVVIDMEHGPIDLSVAASLILAAGGRIGCVVRVPGSGWHGLTQILDLGPDAILFPHIRTADEAARARAECCFPPHGTRAALPTSLESLRLATSWSEGDRTPSGSDTWMLLEDVGGFDSVRDIVNAGDPDVVMLGMVDLALDAGLPVPRPTAWHPDLIRFARKAIDACEAAGVPVCLTAPVPDDAQHLLDRCGAVFLGSDVGYISAGASRALSEHRERATKKADT